MAILAECPQCHKKQAVKNKLCNCGGDLVKLKKANKVRYWINYRLPDGKQRREPVGLSIEEARDAEGKRRSQKREGRIFDMLPESKMTFSELAEWYTNRDAVQELASYRRVKQVLANFNQVFGDWRVSAVKLDDLEKYQVTRAKQGRAPATIDMEISIAKTMVTKALDNDMVDGKTLKAFRCIKRKLKTGANARTRTLTIDEYLELLDASPAHLRPIIIVAFNTGMRMGELRQMRWSHIDHQAKFIRLPPDITKEKKAKNIPMNHHVVEILRALPRALTHDSVFTYAGKPYADRSAFRRSFKTATRNAGIPVGRTDLKGCTFHDIRRTVKTNMLSAGVEKVYRDIIVGHTLQGMDLNYLVPSEDDLRMAMQKYTEWLDDQLKKVKIDAQLG